MALNGLGSESLVYRVSNNLGSPGIVHSVERCLWQGLPSAPWSVRAPSSVLGRIDLVFLKVVCLRHAHFLRPEFAYFAGR